MQLIIETEEEYAPMFRAVAKAVNAKVRTNQRIDKGVKKARVKPGEEPAVDGELVASQEKPSDLFRGAWENDPARTAKSIRESAWKRRN